MTNTSDMLRMLKNGDYYQICNRLRDSGWSEIGSGAYSSCYGKDTEDYVVKVSSDGIYGMHMGDKFFELLEFQSAGFDVFTKVLDFYNTDSVSVCISERLKNFNRNDSRERLTQRLAKMLNKPANLIGCGGSYTGLVLETFVEFGVKLHDVHAGNFYIHESGRVEFIDYGCYQDAEKSVYFSWEEYWTLMSLIVEQRIS